MNIYCPSSDNNGGCCLTSPHSAAMVEALDALEHVNVVLAVILCMSVVVYHRCMQQTLASARQQALSSRQHASTTDKPCQHRRRTPSIEDWDVLNHVIDDLLLGCDVPSHAEPLPLVGEGLALAMYAAYHISSVGVLRPPTATY
ncbi:hypothetical protein SPRG_16391 [Saprolegnia parasitica CBS 223.65]|uniref:Uncharacterized protein n=1 Tax=Saprolegnia parasitica (strain CBS 223.65) TaxID=695850 RepID=A0A067BN94_SAPPC|nr:hypothetical protein SPRG_16391 [Saprolegnia parasitica CBS 223.65]KDO18195.1 hypothetical protein SPRG_16391 [Saprolegnia parasitica CBS 223.65]|eukprot:XP_012211092.1 hypothetical protein SPRG_16391 [Saprolegnia parasitica CBS 223.65]